MDMGIVKLGVTNVEGCTMATDKLKELREDLGTYICYSITDGGFEEKEYQSEFK